MDWTSDSDGNNDSDLGTGKAVVAVASHAAAGPSNSLPVVNCISDSDESADFDWDAEEEAPIPASGAAAGRSNELILDSLKAFEAGPSHTNWTSHFVAMGFSEELVAKVIEQNRGDTDSILDTLLNWVAIEKSPNREACPLDCSSASDKNLLEDDFSGMEDFGFEDDTHDFTKKDKIVSTLVDMGFLAEEASSAIDRCGPNASILELADSIHAAQMQEDSDDQLFEPSASRTSGYYDDDKDSAYNYHKEKKRKSSEFTRKNKTMHSYERKKEFMKKMRLTNDDDLSPPTIPKPMIGFGLPFQQPRITHRKLPEAAIGRPFFYYENVALASKGAWDKISRFLYDIEPEFVDSKFFCAAARKRGYIHNLPINNRFPLLPIPPKTIHEAFPATKKWWPSWDTRTHLNCLRTCTGSAKLTERIRVALSQSNDPPPERVQKYVLDECRKWNLVWVGLHKVAPLEPDEIEMLLGFPRNHTRGISRTERYKSLGNSFQLDTVAFHLSVLRDMFPNGMTVLSLFSGIGGAEVALHRLGIRLKTVVSVELSEINRNIVRSWWEQTNQTGTLIDISDVQQLNGNQLEKLIHTYGGFDLVIGGSPCNNLTGSNRHSRDGLEGKDSGLFFDYHRILDHVKTLMAN